MVARAEAQLLVASSDGRGFVTRGEATLAETRKGKQLVNLRPGARVAVVRRIPEGADAVAVDRREPQDAGVPAGRTARAGRGQGVTLQRYPRRRAGRCDRVPPGRRAQLGAGRRERAGADRRAT